VIATQDGLTACAGGTVDLDEYFFPGARDQLEWECVELSMRWMYLDWGVNPYSAFGFEVGTQYAVTKATYNPNGPALTLVANGTHGVAPQPGDVISIGDGQPGHTVVVYSVDTGVRTTGNGYISVIQQNAGAGTVSFHVTNWRIDNRSGIPGGNVVSGWLHYGG
jgi:hypothetical protein